MLTFLFWNLNGKPLQDRVARIVASCDVDVFILAECDVAAPNVLPAIGKVHHSGRFHAVGVGRVRIFSRLGVDVLMPIFDDPMRRLTISRLKSTTCGEILLAVAHFPSKVNWSDGDQALECQNLARDICQVKKDRGHRRTILVGDLNMNPFDAGVVASHGLHSVMTRDLAREATRVVQGREYQFFYNPMWGCLGDRTAGPAGTHFYRGSQPVTYFWNTFDQVLLRPDMLDFFEEDLEILDNDGTDSLVSEAGIPNKSEGSDHLPLLFRLQIDAE